MGRIENEEDKGGMGWDGMGGTFSVGNLSIPCFFTLQGQSNPKMTKIDIVLGHGLAKTYDICCVYLFVAGVR